MELSAALRTTGAIREFTDEPVDDAALYRILDTARFGPSGGNRQAWRVIVVRDPALRRGLRDLYLPGWYDYLALSRSGLVPWAPLGDREAEAQALAAAPEIAANGRTGPGGFVEHLDQIPVLLAVWVDLRALAAVDRDMDRYTFIGGASVYPFCWSVLLAAREEDLGGVMTTMLARAEPQVRVLLRVPEEFALAAVVALGHPVRRPRRLTRREVGEFTTLDHFDGAPLYEPQ
jgi:nitroreductase